MLSTGIPRTLIGVGGIRLINLPGVRYPEAVLKSTPGMDKRTGKPYRRPPNGAITTRRAAQLMQRSLSSTYNYLKKKHVKSYNVLMSDKKVRIYWDYAEIMQLEQQLPKTELHVPKELVQAKDALMILGIVRSTLYRYVISGKIREIKRRIMTTRGYRHQSLFLKSEIMKLKAWRLARQRKNIDWKEFSEAQKTAAKNYAQV